MKTKYTFKYLLPASKRGLMTFFMMLMLLAIGFVSLPTHPVQAVGTYNNADIANYAINNYKEGTHYGDDCYPFVQHIIYQVSKSNGNIQDIYLHGLKNSEYFTHLSGSGGTQIPLNSLSEGDVVQEGNNGGHTYIIIGKSTDPKKPWTDGWYNIVDSNSPGDNSDNIHYYPRKVTTPSSYGHGETRAYRFGTVINNPPASTNNQTSNQTNPNSVALQGSNSNLQGSSGQSLQKTTSGGNLQGSGANSKTVNPSSGQSSKPSLLTSVMGFFNGVASSVASYFHIGSSTSAHSNQTQNVQQTANNTHNGLPKNVPTSTARLNPVISVPQISPSQEVSPQITSNPSNSDTINSANTNSQNCPSGEPTVTLSNVSLIDPKLYPQGNGTHDDYFFRFVVTGTITNPTSTDVRINYIGLYDDNRNPDLAPAGGFVIDMSSGSIELSNQSTIIKAQSSEDFKFKEDAGWRSTDGPLPYKLTPKLKFPGSDTSRPTSHWGWADNNVPSNCDPNYYQY